MASLLQTLPFSNELRPRMRWWPMLVLALFKLVLVSHDEIRSVGADDSGYAHTAALWYWGNSFAPYSYSRQPLYPLFISISQAFGVPYRLWIELAWIGACILTARALAACGVRRGVALLGCAILLFHPTTLTLFARLLPDSLYTIGWMVFVASLAAAMCQTSVRAMLAWGGGATVGAMIAANARPEEIMVWGVLFMCGVLIVAACRLGWQRPDDGSLRRRLLWSLGVCVLLPAAGVIASTQAFAAVNQARIGARVSCDLKLPGFTSLYRTLLAIPPKEPNLRLPIQRDVRDRAYAASPSFRRLEPYLDGDLRRPEYAAACFKQTGVEGEYGGWTIWALRRATWAMNSWKWKDAAELDAYYAQCAAELRAAMDNGDLPSRSVPVSFVPPEWGLLAAQLPASLRKCWGSLNDIGGWSIAEQPVTPEFGQAFDAAAGRRITLLAMNKGTPAEHSVWHRAAVTARITKIRMGITKVGQNVIPVIPITALVGTIMALAVPWKRPKDWSPRRRGIVLLLVMIWGAGIARTLFIAVLDANAVDSQERYMFPAGVMLALLLPVGLAATFESMRSLIRRDRPRNPATPAAAA